MPVACGDYHALFLDPEGKVSAIGRNKGQLGLGDQNRPTKVTEVTGLPPITHVATAKNGYHSVFLDNNGEVWGCGKNKFGQLGVPSARKQPVLKPTKVPNLPKIVNVACGGYHTILLDDTGSIWGSGNNENGELGIVGREVVKNFTKIDTAKVGKVTKVDCGEGFTVLLNESGELWGTGENGFGQLGLGHNDNVSEFQKIALAVKEPVHDFCAAVCHILIFDKKGQVWSAGMNNTGQLGLGDTASRSDFVQVTNIPEIQKIFCGGYASLLLDQNGGVHVCGDNDAGQLGFGHNNKVTTPKLIPNFTKKVIEASGGYQFNLLVDEDGKVWGCGNNEDGQLANDDEIEILSFTIVEGVPLIK